MKKIVLTLCIIFGASAMLFAQGWRTGEMEVEVSVSDRYTANEIAALGLSGDYDNGKIVLYVTPAELKKIATITNDFIILKDDMNAWAENAKATLEAYHSYDEIIALADSLAENFPEICQKIIFGNSIQNRQLAALKISDNVAVDEPEAEVMFDGGIHGDEIGAAENVIRFARDLCLAYGEDATITDLIDNREIWLYLMVNPDGRVNMSRYNAAGVDINRDWPFMWNGEGSSSGPASQPESKALRNCTYNNQFVIHTTYHSGTEYISCPWSYRADQPADLPGILHLAGVYADESGYANIDYGQGCTGMYPINGSSKDFNFGAMGSVSWSMEISYDKQPPASQLMSFYLKNKPSMIAMIEYSGYGIEGVVTNAETGDPVQAAIFIENLYPCYSDPVVGDFHKYLMPGTYNLVVKANGYENAVVENVVINDLESTVVDVVMTPVEGGNYICKYAACQIPDNNTADEGNVPAVIGAPDNVNYSIGKNGWIIFDMQNEILNMEGDEITIYEGDDTPEGYTLMAGQSIDGPWISLGEGEGTASFDLSTGNVVSARYFKLIDNGNGTANSPNAGFDFDAAENIAEVSDIYILLDNIAIAEVNGNGNGIPEPGEELSLALSIRNNGVETAPAVEGLLECMNPDVTITDPAYTFGDIASDAAAEGTFLVTLSDQIPEGFPVMMTLNITADEGSYSSSINISFTAGAVMEDFETGDFSNVPWEFEGNSDWLISSPGQGSDFCAESGTITDNQSTSLVLMANILTDGEISFFRKVSSESGYDFLQFFIDNVLVDQWSGTQGWSEVTYNVSAGRHTFKWTYMKDGYVGSGSDKGWIDNISFPSVSFNETGNLVGLVTDAASSEPLENVIITALHQSLWFYSTAETEGETGFYHFDHMPVGEYELCYEKEGYVSYCQMATVVAGETIQYDAQLQYGVGTDNIENVLLLNTYPNPVSDGSVTISCKDGFSDHAVLSVLNTSGVELLKMDFEGKRNAIILDDAQVNAFPQGLYTIRIVDGKTLFLSKLIKL